MNGSPCSRTAGRYSCATAPWRDQALKRGFAASIALVGILVAIAGVAVVNLSDSFVFVRRAAETTQKAQLAMARITKEFEHLVDTSSGDATGITFESLDVRPPE